MVIFRVSYRRLPIAKLYIDSYMMGVAFETRERTLAQNVSGMFAIQLGTTTSLLLAQGDDLILSTLFLREIL